MANLSHIQHRLTYLLLFVLSLGPASPVAAQYRDVYNRAEQTDADYEPERIEELIGLVKSGQDSDRAIAVWNLEALGPEARRSIPMFIDFLDDQSMTIPAPVRVSDSASMALEYLGAEAVAPLVKAFPQAPPEEKRMIARTAALLGPDARELVPVFRKQYVSVKPEERWRYLWALALIDPTGETAFPAILIALRNAEDSYGRRLAAECLRIEGSPDYGDWPSQTRNWFQQRQQNPEIAVNALLQALRDKEPSVRGAAINSLAGYTAYEKQIVPELIQLLDDDAQYSVMISNHLQGVEYVSDRAAYALTSFPGSAETIVPAMIAWALRDGPAFKPNPERQLADLIPSTNELLKYVRQLMQSREPELALLTIARMGEQTRSLKPQLEVLTKSDDDELALPARLALACLESSRQPDVLKFLNREYLKVGTDQEQSWTAAVGFLAQVGKNAAFARPVFETGLATPLTPELTFEVDREAAALFLADIGAGSPETTAVILGLIKEDLWFFPHYENALVRMCPGIVPHLVEILGDEFSSATEKIACLRVLGGAHAEIPELVPLIAAQLKSNHPAVRESAVQALGEIGTKDEQSVKALIEALGDPRVRVRAKSLESLAKFGDQAEPAIPHITKCLSDGYLTVRVAAVRCLGELGSVAAPAVDELEKLKDAESLLLRETSAEALAKIRL